MSFFCKVSAWPFCSNCSPYFSPVSLHWLFHALLLKFLSYWNCSKVQIVFFSWKKVFVLFRLQSFLVIFSRIFAGFITGLDALASKFLRSLMQSVLNRNVFFMQSFAWPFCSRIFCRFHFIWLLHEALIWNFWVIEIALIQIACFYSWKVSMSAFAWLVCRSSFRLLLIVVGLDLLVALEGSLMQSL